MPMKNYISNIIFGVFLLVGIGMIVGSIFLFKDFSEFKETAEEVSARILKIESYYDSDDDLHHRVYVTYTYEGVVYDGITLNFYSSDMFQGKEITLLCNPDFPTDVRGASALDPIGMILLFMGIIFALVGGIPQVFSIKKHLQNKRLMQEGKVLHAVVENVDFNPNVTVNGKCPYVIYCNYQDEYKNVLYRFKSDDLWTDPSPVFPPGSYIDVLVDPNDYSKYHVNAQQMIEQRIVDYT